jgi:hypothetical protein
MNPESMSHGQASNLGNKIGNPKKVNRVEQLHTSSFRGEL